MNTIATATAAIITVIGLLAGMSGCMAVMEASSYAPVSLGDYCALVVGAILFVGGMQLGVLVALLDGISRKDR